MGPSGKGGGKSGRDDDKSFTRKFPPNCRVFIGNLAAEKTSSAELASLFCKYGRLAEDPLLRRSFGFVQFETPEAAQAAIRGAQGLEVGGIRIDVTLADNRPVRSTKNDEDREEKRDRRDRRGGERGGKRDRDRDRDNRSRSRSRSRSKSRGRGGGKDRGRDNKDGGREERGYRKGDKGGGRTTSDSGRAKTFDPPSALNDVFMVKVDSPSRSYCLMVEEKITNLGLLYENREVDVDDLPEVLKIAAENSTVKHILVVGSRHEGPNTITITTRRKAGAVEEFREVPLEQALRELDPKGKGEAQSKPSGQPGAPPASSAPRGAAPSSQVGSNMHEILQMLQQAQSSGSGMNDSTRAQVMQLLQSKPEIRNALVARIQQAGGTSIPPPSAPNAAQNKPLAQVNPHSHPQNPQPQATMPDFRSPPPPIPQAPQHALQHGGHRPSLQQQPQYGGGYGSDQWGGNKMQPPPQHAAFPQQQHGMIPQHHQQQGGWNRPAPATPVQNPAPAQPAPGGLDFSSIQDLLAVTAPLLNGSANKEAAQQASQGGLGVFGAQTTFGGGQQQSSAGASGTSAAEPSNADLLSILTRTAQQQQQQQNSQNPPAQAPSHPAPQASFSQYNSTGPSPSGYGEGSGGQGSSGGYVQTSGYTAGAQQSQSGHGGFADRGGGAGYASGSTQQPSASYQNSGESNGGGHFGYSQGQSQGGYAQQAPQPQQGYKQGYNSLQPAGRGVPSSQPNQTPLQNVRPHPQNMIPGQNMVGGRGGVPIAPGMTPPGMTPPVAPHTMSFVPGGAPPGASRFGR